MTLLALRRRMPLIAFILLAVVCAVLLGFTCACLSDHPGQALERAVAAIHVAPALVEVWGFAALTFAATLTLLPYGRRVARSPTPAALQRFLF